MVFANNMQDPQGTNPPLNQPNPTHQENRFFWLLDEMLNRLNSITTYIMGLKGLLSNPFGASSAIPTIVIPRYSAGLPAFFESSGYHKILKEKATSKAKLFCHLLKLNEQKQSMQHHLNTGSFPSYIDNQFRNKTMGLSDAALFNLKKATLQAHIDQKLVQISTQVSKYNNVKMEFFILIGQLFATSIQDITSPIQQMDVVNAAVQPPIPAANDANQQAQPLDPVPGAIARFKDNIEDHFDQMYGSIKAEFIATMNRDAEKKRQKKEKFDEVKRKNEELVQLTRRQVSDLQKLAKNGKGQQKKRESGDQRAGESKKKKKPQTKTGKGKQGSKGKGKK